MYTKNIENLILELNARKDHIKTFLVKNFTINKDYTINLVNKIKINGGGGWNKEEIFMTEDTYNLILNSYNIKNKYTKCLQKNIINPFIINIESNTIGFLQYILKDIVITYREFKCNIYRIDLYIPIIKLAIECDEFKHNTYDKINEINRENIIKKELSCEFYRFNPCDKNFIFEDFINNILKEIFLRK